MAVVGETGLTVEERIQLEQARKAALEYARRFGEIEDLPKGKRHREYDCPLARALAHTTGANFVTVTPQLATLDGCGEDLPESVGEFVVYFDAGHYPDLEE